MRFSNSRLTELMAADSIEAEVLLASSATDDLVTDEEEDDLDTDEEEEEEEDAGADEAPPEAAEEGQLTWPEYPPTRLDPPKPEPGQPDGWLESDALPKADVLVITWTTDEARALHDVLAKEPSPEGPEREWRDLWYPYTRNFWKVYQELWNHRLTQWYNRSSLQTPSLNEDRDTWYRKGVFGRFCRISIGDRVVLLFQSSLHLNTDGRTLPLVFMLEQLLEEVEPTLVLTVGTSGGVDPGHHLGDVVVTNQALFHLSDEFADASFNHHLYTSSWTPPAALVSQANQLLRQVSEGELWAPCPQYGQLISAPIVPQEFAPEIRISEKPIITTDRFEFGTTVNNLHRLGCAVEMGDAMVAKVCHEQGVEFGVVRNLSDPVINGNVPGILQGTYASEVYQAHGYDTSFNSSVAVWAMIAGEIAAGRPARRPSSRGPAPVYREPPFVPREERPQEPLPSVNWEEEDPKPEPIGPPAPSGLPDAERWAPLPEADALILVWNRPGLEAVQRVFFDSSGYRSWEAYGRNSHEILRELYLQEQLRRDRSDYLRAEGLAIRGPRRRQRLGRYRLAAVGDKRVLLLHTALSIRTDGATLPIQRLVKQAIEEVDPRAVLSVGTAAAVTEADSVLGSVLLTTSATYWLGNEFDGFPSNGETYASDWGVPTDYHPAAEAKMLEVEWPELAVPTVSYPDPDPPLIPPLQSPSIRVVSQPMLTAPRRYSMGFFYVRLFEVATAYNGLDRYGCAVDTRDAVVAEQCAEKEKGFASVRAIAVPMMNSARGKTRVMRTWAQFFEDWTIRRCSYNAALAAWSIVAGM